MFETNFKNYLKTENLVEKKLLLCVSGGIDSCVLLFLAQKLVNPENLAVFHLDHNTRKNSKTDFVFVQKMCSDLKIEFFGEKLEKTTPSQKMKKGLEDFWREARGKKAKSIAQKVGAERILTAHHASDFCETMIFRLTKGAGLSGLFPFDISTKPLWKVSKTEILAYAEQNNIDWVEDPSNKNLEFQRNLIRHKVIPELEKITPNLEKVFLREAEIFRNAQSFIDDSLCKLIDFEIHKVELSHFQKLPLILKQEFLRKIAKKTPSFSEIEDCLKWLNHKPKGGSQKKIGETEVCLEKGLLKW